MDVERKGLFAGLGGALLVALAVALSMLILPTSAAAQQRHQRSFLDFLFGPRQAYPPAPPPPQRSYRSRTSRPRNASRSAPASPPAPPPVEKLENAREILVVGDFMASGLADGLQEAFAESPGVVVKDRTNGSSGLVRDDYYDWPAEIGPILDEEKPAIAVVLVGSNDRQEMKIGGATEPVRSDKWTEEYTRRVEAVAAAVKQRHIPLLWVGVPAFQSPSMSADILAFDGIFRSVVEKAGGEFIDTWDGFVDENGKFVFTGSDINGQQVRLRGPDGINLTKAGKRKLAFYVEKSARRILGDAADIGVARLTDENLPDLLMLSPQVPTEIVRTRPISLDDPELDGGAALLGGPNQPPVDPKAPRTLLVRQGKVEPPPAGRADNFNWKPDGAPAPETVKASAAGPAAPAKPEIAE